MSNYSSVYEIAEKYNYLSGIILYPKSIPGMPVLGSFPNARVFGVALEKWEEEKQASLQARKEYNQAREKLTQDFKRDLLEHLEISDHPKAEVLWRLAWEHGHSSGYNDVASYAEDFSELMK